MKIPKNSNREKLMKVLEIKEAYAAGKLSLQEGRQKLKDEVGTLIPSEIAWVEQELKEMEEDECRREDLQTMLELFDDVLAHPEAKLPEDHPISHYYQENEILKKKLEVYDKRLDDVETPIDWLVEKKRQESMMEYVKHYQRKQNQLYSALERVGFSRPTTTMWTYDDIVRDDIKRLAKYIDLEDDFAYRQALKTFLVDAKDLCSKEEGILYPTSLELLSDDVFEAMKEGDKEIGFAWIKPENKLTQSAIPTFQSGMIDEKTVLPVTMGGLTLEQINLIYQHLPVDLSFVDEKDLVCFYSDSPHRIFPRSRGAIGRNVRNCHPSRSIAQVEAIIEAFRKGEQDKAEFWINKDEIFIYIIYVAVRDAEGKFRGVLEMMQECSHIRSLEGSQTLLSWTDKVKKSEPELVSDVVETKSEPKLEAEPVMEVVSNTESEVKSYKTVDGFEINKATKLKDLLERYPFLKEKMMKANPVFMVMKTPFFKMMLPKATIEKMAGRSGLGYEGIVSLIIRLVEEGLNE